MVKRDEVPTKVERLGGGASVICKSEASFEAAMNRRLPDRLQRPPTLMERLMVRAGAVPPPMPAKVRAKAPKRVQEAMQVVEDYVAGLDGKEVSEGE